MVRPRVVEARLAHHPEAHVPPDRLRAPHDVVGVPFAADRHEVRDLGHALVGEEARQQDAGVGQVELLLPRALQEGGQPEPAAPRVVQQGAEDGRRVEAGRAHEVDRAVHPHERHRVEVADDPVVLDRLVAHAGMGAAAPAGDVLIAGGRSGSTAPVSVGAAGACGARSPCARPDGPSCRSRSGTGAPHARRARCTP